MYRWWDCISLPDDVDTSDEAAFRMQIRQLAFEVSPMHYIFYKNVVSLHSPAVLAPSISTPRCIFNITPAIISSKPTH